MESDNHDSRWICWQCGDLDYLNDEGLCWECAPERVAEFVEVAIRALCGEREKVEKVERVWRIG